MVMSEERNKQTTEMLLLVVGVLIVSIVGNILGTPIFTELNTAYTSTYVNGTTAIFHNNQQFISLAGLGYILAVVFIPLALLGILTYKSNREGMFNMSEMISKIIMILILVFVGIILYLVLLPIASSFYTAVSSYTWATNYLSLISLETLFFVLGIVVMVLFEAISIIRDILAR